MSADFPVSERELAFVDQSIVFVQKALHQFSVARVDDLPRIQDRPPCALRPTILSDFEALTDTEVERIANDYFGEFGVAYFIVANPRRRSDRHPLLAITDQLKDALDLRYPIAHPLEAHPETIRRFGAADGTIKLYDLNKDPKSGYREQGETSELFAAHNDGLGYAGTVRSTAMYLDSPPIWGGYTYFANVVLLALNLLSSDEVAFRSLFLPDAITALRPRGKGAIKVTCPILFLNEDGLPSVFYRVATGEYEVIFREDVPALHRAIEFLKTRTVPFGQGSSFAHFSSEGHGCVARNQQIVHGRTEFLDEGTGWRRVLARKWFMSGGKHMTYKHVPGMALQSDYADLYPEYFGQDVLCGEWQYDRESGENRRTK